MDKIIIHRWITDNSKDTNICVADYLFVKDCVIDNELLKKCLYCFRSIFFDAGNVKTISDENEIEDLTNAQSRYVLSCDENETVFTTNILDLSCIILELDYDTLNAMRRSLYDVENFEKIRLYDVVGKRDICCVEFTDRSLFFRKLNLLIYYISDYVECYNMRLNIRVLQNNTDNEKDYDDGNNNSIISINIASVIGRFEDLFDYKLLANC